MIKISSTNESISVAIEKDNKISIASADNLRDGRWWISRVNVLLEEREKGVGSMLLKQLIKEVLKYGPSNIIVAPGGYNMDLKSKSIFIKRMDLK